jgi:membrane protease YdiL (CAAX protease family)
MRDLFLNEKFLAAFAILTVLVLFFLYYYLTAKRVLYKLFLRLCSDSVSKESLEFASVKLAGIILTGLIPCFFFILIVKVIPSGIGFTLGRINHIVLILTCLILITLLVSFLSSKSPEIQKKSPELRIKIWHLRHLLLSSASWLIYIFGYEFFFRGILWFLCYRAFGFWWALAINVLLYSLVHIPKGRLMIIGAVPLGIIFCVLSYTTDSFFPAFLIHAAMAISTELFSVYHNPEFEFNITRSGK